MNEILIKNLAKNPKMIAKFIGYSMTSEEGYKMWNEGIVPNRLYKKFLENEKLFEKKNTKENQLKRYIYFAHLDRNASDSECFEHISTRKDDLHRVLRFGRCKVTGKEYEVEPHKPGDNSGQPMECYEHFELRKSYKDKIPSFGDNYHLSI